MTSYHRLPQPKTARVRGGGAGSQGTMSNLPRLKQPSAYPNPNPQNPLASPLTSSLNAGSAMPPNSAVPTTSGAQTQPLTASLSGSMAGWKDGGAAKVAQKPPGGIPGMDKGIGGMPGIPQSPDTSGVPGVGGATPQAPETPQTPQMPVVGGLGSGRAPVSDALMPTEAPADPPAPITPPPPPPPPPPMPEQPGPLGTTAQPPQAQPLDASLLGGAAQAHMAAAQQAPGIAAPTQQVQPLTAALGQPQAAAPQARAAAPAQDWTRGAPAAHVSSMQGAPAQAQALSPHQKRVQQSQTLRELGGQQYVSQPPGGSKLIGKVGNRDVYEYKGIHIATHPMKGFEVFNPNSGLSRMVASGENFVPAGEQPAVEQAPVQPAVEQPPVQPAVEKPRFAEVGEAATQPPEQPAVEKPAVEPEQPAALTPGVPADFRKGYKTEMASKLVGLSRGEPAGKWNQWEQFIDPDKEYDYIDPVVGTKMKARGSSLIRMFGGLNRGYGIGLREDSMRLLEESGQIDSSKHLGLASKEDRQMFQHPVELQEAWETEQKAKGIHPSEVGTPPRGWQPGAAVEQPAVEKPPADKFAEVGEAAYESEKEGAARPEYSRQAEWEAGGRTGAVPKWFGGTGSWEKYDEGRAAQQKHVQDVEASQEAAVQPAPEVARPVHQGAIPFKFGKDYDPKDMSIATAVDDEGTPLVVMRDSTGRINVHPKSNFDSMMPGLNARAVQGMEFLDWSSLTEEEKKGASLAKYGVKGNVSASGQQAAYEEKPDALAAPERDAETQAEADALREKIAQQTGGEPVPQQPVAEQPAPDQPVAEGEAPPKKFAEVGEAAYQPDKKDAGWMTSEKEKEEGFAEAAPTPTDAEFRKFVFSGKKFTAEDMKRFGKTPKDVLDLGTKYNQWKKEYEAKFNAWKEEYESKPVEPEPEVPQPPVEPVQPPVPPEVPPEVPSPELPVQPPEEPAVEPDPTGLDREVTLPDGRVMTLRDALNDLYGWNAQQPGQPAVAPPGQPGGIGLLPDVGPPSTAKPPEDEDEDGWPDPLPGGVPPDEVIEELMPKENVIEVDPGISREYITQRGENPQLEANRRIAELFQQAGPMQRSLLGQAGRGMAADVGTRSQYGLAPMAQAMLGARQAQTMIPWQRNLEQAQQERQRMDLAHRLGLQQAQMVGSDYYEQARLQLQEEQRRWGILQNLLNPLLSRRG